MSVAGTRDQLRRAGFDDRQAEALATAIDAANRQPDLSTIMWATGLMAVVVVAALGWGIARDEINQTETNQRIDAFRVEVREEVRGNREEIAAINERLTRIETILDERLPPRPP